MTAYVIGGVPIGSRASSGPIAPTARRRRLVGCVVTVRLAVMVSADAAMFVTATDVGRPLYEIDDGVEFASNVELWLPPGYGSPASPRFAARSRSRLPSAC